MVKFANVTDAVKAINTCKRVRIVANGAGHSYPMGVLEVISAGFINANTLSLGSPRGSWSVYLTDIEPVLVTQEQVKAEIKKLEEQLVTEKAKLNYLVKTRQTEVNDTEFKVWNTLQVLKGRRNDLEKAKAIAALING